MIQRSTTYFIADLHIGATYITDPRDHERRVVDFLRSIKDDAKTLYLMGDVLDYWFEYKKVVPRGYIRFFGALAELADAGVEIIWFVGNHDIWLFDYLRDEIGLKVVDGVEIREIDGKRFFLSHGDGVGRIRPVFRFIRSLFRNRFCQWLFSGIHPRWTVGFAHSWSAHSRGKGSDARFQGEKEPQIEFARGYLAEHPDIDFFIFGHRHIARDYPLDDHTRLMMLGDCFKQFTYATFDGKELKLSSFADNDKSKQVNQPKN